MIKVKLLKTMIAASWGDSDSDVDHEKQKTRCLMADDDQVSNHDDKTYLRTMVFELKRIIDAQAKTIKDNDNLIEIQLKTMK